MAMGLFVALGRLYGPECRWPGCPLRIYVEVIRGTPLIIQLYTPCSTSCPTWGSPSPPGRRAWPGLSINYSAYEAEIYRSRAPGDPPKGPDGGRDGARDVPKGLALRRVIVPQAVRIVIPPVDERLHRPVQGHLGLLGDHPDRADEAVFDPLQQPGGGVIEFGLATAAALHGDEPAAVVVLPMGPGAEDGRRKRRSAEGGIRDDRGRRIWSSVMARSKSSGASRSSVEARRGRGDHRPFRRGQEHVPPLPHRPGILPGRVDHRSTA